MLRKSMLISLFLTTLFAFSGYSLANDSAELRHHGGSFCRGVKFSPEQVGKIKELYKSYGESTKTKRQENRQAWKSYQAILAQVSSTREQAETELKKAITIRVELSTARAGLRNQVLYEIATPEQRVKIAQCIGKKRHPKRRGPRDKDPSPPTPAPNDKGNPPPPQPEPEPEPQSDQNKILNFLSDEI